VAAAPRHFANRLGSFRAAACGLAVVCVASLWLGACSALPEDGPSARAVENGAKPPTGAKYALVDVDYRVTQTISANPDAPLATLTGSPLSGPTDLIAVGDTLAISIYQPGAGPTAQQTVSATDSHHTEPQSLPPSLVGPDGAVTIPFAGNVHVVNLTPSEAADAIRKALRGRMADPQILVSSVASPRNSVIVFGEVSRPGRYPLVANADRLLDALAAAGGATKSARDLAVTVVRGDQSATVSLQALFDDPRENIRLGPLDQIRVTGAQRKVDVFGSVGRGSEIPIGDDSLTLAGALGRIGGLNGGLADAKSVLVFRFERPEIAKALGVDVPNIPALKSVPIVYRVNLRDPSGYFIANKFEVESNDLIYVPTANAAELQKFLTIVNSAAQFFYDAAVAKGLGL